MYQFHQEQHFYTLQQEEEKLKQKRSSWVMTTPEQEGFVKLPHERILHKSPPRTSLDITSSKNPYPGAQPFTAKSEGGIVYVTNQRVCVTPFRLFVAKINLLLGSLPPVDTNARTTIFLRAIVKFTRYICTSTVLRCKLLDSIM